MRFAFCVCGADHTNQVTAQKPAALQEKELSTQNFLNYYEMRINQALVIAQ